MGAFFSSLLGSYSGAMLQKHREERAKEDKQIDAELEVLKLAVRDPSISQEGREAAFERMEELTGQGGKGKKKSGFSFKNLIGKFGDVGQQPGKTLQQTVQGRQAEPAGGVPTSTGAPSTGQPASPGGAQAPGTAPPVPTRPRVFRTQQQMDQETINFENKRRLEVTQPQLDYEHKLRLEEIEKQYGGKLTTRNNVQGSSVPPTITADLGGNPIDGKKKYSVLFNSQNQAVGAIGEYERPASSRASGPEAKVESLKKDLMAEAQGQGRTITEDQAEIQARRMVLAQARASLLSTLESVKGKQFANKVRADLEKGVMTPATARGVIGYVGAEAKRRFADDMQTIASGKSIKEIEDELYQELGTSREQIATYLRQGAASPKKGEPGNQKTNRFDSSLNPVPERAPVHP
jgi:hypothetical protein